MSDEVSTKDMDSMLHSLFLAVHASDKNGDVLKVLKSGNFESLSEDEKVHVLTRIEPDNAKECSQRRCVPSKRMVKSDSYGLLSFIIRWDRVRCLKIVLQFLPLYSVYEREVTSPSTDAVDKSARETLYKTKAVWEIPVTIHEIIEKQLYQDIRFLSEIIEETRRKVEDANAHLENIPPVSGANPAHMMWCHQLGVVPILAELKQYSKRVRDQIEKLQQTLTVLSITGCSKLDEAANEAIGTTGKCIERAKRCIQSMMIPYTHKRPTFKTMKLKTLKSDIVKTRQFIKEVILHVERGMHTVETMRSWEQRAGGESDAASDNDEKQLSQDSHETLKKDTFVLLAAQIFTIASKYQATQCATLLLNQAPDLVHVEVEGKLALASALTSPMYSRQIVGLLVKRRARVGRVDELTDLFTWKPEKCKRDAVINYVNGYPAKEKNDENEDGESEFDEKVHETEDDDSIYKTIHVDWHYRAKLMMAGKEDQVKSYRDQQGNTLLHILVAQLNIVNTSVVDHDTFYKCVKELLKAGINPIERNISGHSALHVLFNSMQYPSLRSTYFLLFDCVQLLLPYFKNMNMKDEDLLKNLVAARHFNSLDDQWIQVYTSMMENDVMDAEFIVNSGRTPLHILLRGYELHSTNSAFTCIMCKPISDLCSLAIQKGCNITRFIDVIVSGPKRVSRCINNPPAIVNGMLWAVHLDQHNSCCYLTLLKVLLNNGADIRPLVQLNPQNANIITLMRMVTDPESEFYGYRFFMGSQEFSV